MDLAWSRHSANEHGTKQPPARFQCENLHLLIQIRQGAASAEVLGITHGSVKRREPGSRISGFITNIPLAKYLIADPFPGDSLLQAADIFGAILQAAGALVSSGAAQQPIKDFPWICKNHSWGTAI